MKLLLTLGIFSSLATVAFNEQLSNYALDMPPAIALIVLTVLGTAALQMARSQS